VLDRHTSLCWRCVSQHTGIPISWIGALDGRELGKKKREIAARVAVYGGHEACFVVPVCFVDGVLDDAEGVDPKVFVPESESRAYGFLVNGREFVPWDGLLKVGDVGHEEFEMRKIWVAPHVAKCEVLEVLVGHVTAELDGSGCDFEDACWASVVLLDGVAVEVVTLGME